MRLQVMCEAATCELQCLVLQTESGKAHVIGDEFMVAQGFVSPEPQSLAAWRLPREPTSQLGAAKRRVADRHLNEG